MKFIPFRILNCIIPFLIAAVISFFSFHNVIGQVSSGKYRPRIVITADPELDNNNSLIRLLLYCSDLQIEGLTYASSGFHWKGDGKGTKWSVANREYNRIGLNLRSCESWQWGKDERFIYDAIDAYAKVYPNLKLHNPDYPSPAELKAKIRCGNIDFDSDISKLFARGGGILI